MDKNGLLNIADYQREELIFVDDVNRVSLLFELKGFFVVFPWDGLLR